MSYGFVYLMSNPAMPWLHKIGMTEFAPHRRLRELSSATCVPIEFVMNCFVEVEDCRASEADFHRAFSDFRFNSGREFFLFRPGNMLHVVGAFKGYDYALSYTECDISDFYLPGLEIVNPWNGEGEVRLPLPPACLADMRESL